MTTSFPLQPHMQANFTQHLNSTMLGRCCLAYYEEFDSNRNPSDYFYSLQLGMAHVFELLAAEITVLRQENPGLSAEAFARQLLDEADMGDDTWPDQEEDEEQVGEDEWHTHPSLTPEQRNPNLQS